MQVHPQIRVLIWQSKVLLRTASLLVPKPQRAAWYQKKFDEVWHWLHFLAESGKLSAQTPLELYRTCWQAFPDAGWHRFNREKVLLAYNEWPRTPRFTLSAILVALVFVVLASGLLPTIRSAFKPLPFSQPDRLAYLSMRGSFTKFDEQNLFRTSSQWAEHSKTTEKLAIYSWHPVRLIFPTKNANDISARISPNFFDVLGSKAELGRLFAPGDAENCASCVVITHELWAKQFHSDRNIIGMPILLDGRPGTVIGVLREDFVFNFPEISVWVMPSWGVITNNFADRTGAVLRMQPRATLTRTSQEIVHLAALDGYSKAQIESFSSRSHVGAKMYLFFTALSLLGGIILGGSRLAIAKTRKITLTVSQKVRWWGFLVLKTFLLIVLCFIGSLEFMGRASVMLTGSIHPFTGAFSTWLFLVTAMAAISWSLNDQGKRCRLCLRRLSNEASVGTPGYLLLGWWGTELVCSDGHGILHVPEMKSSWQSFDQWVSLDESWKPLFKHEEPVHTP